MEPARRWLRQHILAADAIVALAVFAVGALSIRIFYDLTVAGPYHFRFAVGMACMSVLTLSLALRRRAAPLMLAGVTVGLVGYTVFRISDDSLVLTVVFLAIYSAGVWCEPRVANPVRAACIAVMFADVVWARVFVDLDVRNTRAPVIGAALMAVGVYAVFFVLAWVLGDVARIARHRAGELAARNAELEAAQTVIAEAAVLGERVRIARELHDVVAHHVSVMGVQAGAARRVMNRDPDQAVELLAGIENSSRQAVAELQRLLGFLRSATPDGPAGLAPPPGLAQLESLIGGLNDAGLQISTVTSGDGPPIPPSVDLSAFRVVQEALTNALKHSGAGTSVTVTIRRTPASLAVSVVDDGNGRPLPAVGNGQRHGLTGMRERVALHGGVFTAGYRGGSGFAVEATFPCALVAAT